MAQQPESAISCPCRLGLTAWPEAFTCSNYISEHLDCLIHSFQHEMKAVTLVSFPFTLHKKRTFIGAFPSCPWGISSTSNMSCSEGKTSAVSGYTWGTGGLSDMLALVQPLKFSLKIIKLSELWDLVSSNTLSFNFRSLWLAQHCFVCLLGFFKLLEEAQIRPPSHIQPSWEWGRGGLTLIINSIIRFNMWCWKTALKLADIINNGTYSLIFTSRLTSCHTFLKTSGFFRLTECSIGQKEVLWQFICP